MFALLPEVDFPHAQQVDEQCLERQPVYGNYWQSERWGWYGARRVVRTPADARDTAGKSSAICYANGISFCFACIGLQLCAFCGILLALCLFQ